MKKLIDRISPFNVAGLVAVLLAAWMFFYAGTGPHGYGRLAGGVFLISSIIFFTLDVFMLSIFKNSKAYAYLIQIIIIALIVGWYLF